jgi:hypothetical protein
MSQAVAFVIPLLPGKTDTERTALASMQSGERQADAAASRRRHGITREAAWIQSTPAGDVVVVFLEADDLGAAFGGIATSTDPFDVWFREHNMDVHGIDLAEGFPPPEQILDFRG